MKSKAISKIFITLIFITSCFLVSACNKSSNDSKENDVDNVVMLSLSSDGKYAVTTNMDNRAYIWKINQQAHRRIGVKPVNTYSAYFIPQSQNILIQNAETNEVYIEDIAGNVIKTINPGFQVFGEAISSDLKTYIAADESYNVYKFDLETQKRQQLFVSWCDVKGTSSTYDKDNPYYGDLPNGCAGFSGSLPNFTFTKDNQYLVFNAGEPITIWNLSENTWDQVDKTAWPNETSITPDNQSLFVVGKNQLGYKYEFSTKTSSPVFNYNEANDESPSSINFISQKYIVMTMAGENNQSQVHLFNVKDIHNQSNASFDEIKVVDLKSNQEKLYPKTQSYFPTVATSIESNRLVMAQANGSGILVYKFNPKDLTFKIDWVSSL
jgi:hypothetical protein